MAIARKCDRCGKLYEKYDDVECNGMEVNRVLLSNGIVNKEAYDLCPECCLEFVRWIVDPATSVVKLGMDVSMDEVDTQVEIKEKINDIYGVPKEDSEFDGVEIVRHKDPITESLLNKEGE